MKKLKNYFCPCLEIVYYDETDVVLTSPEHGDNFLDDDWFN